MPKELSMNLVREWVDLTSGAFNVRQIWAERNILTPEGKQQLRVYLNRMVEAGIIAKTKVDGTYRKLDTEKIPLIWETADPNANLPIQLPFDLHTLVKIYPKSIIIFAGSKSEGKTAMLTSCIPLNMENFIIDFYNSETGAEQLHDRFNSLDIPIPPPFATWERYDNFADVIHPDHLSIIDYLETDSEFYLVGDELKAIFRKLNKGVAIIGMQKPPPSVTYFKGVKKVIDRDLAYGGAPTSWKATLYVSMSQHRLKLVYGKVPMNPTINPNNKQWSYDFDERGRIINIEPYEEYEGYQ